MASTFETITDPAALSLVKAATKLGYMGPDVMGIYDAVVSLGHGNAACYIAEAIQWQTWEYIQQVASGAVVLEKGLQQRAATLLATVEAPTTVDTEPMQATTTETIAIGTQVVIPAGANLGNKTRLHERRGVIDMVQSNEDGQPIYGYTWEDPTLRTKSKTRHSWLDAQEAARFAVLTFAQRYDMHERQEAIIRPQVVAMLASRRAEYPELWASGKINSYALASALKLTGDPTVCAFNFDSLQMLCTGVIAVARDEERARTKTQEQQPEQAKQAQPQAQAQAQEQQINPDDIDDMDNPDEQPDPDAEIGTCEDCGQPVKYGQASRQIYPDDSTTRVHVTCPQPQPQPQAGASEANENQSGPACINCDGPLDSDGLCPVCNPDRSLVNGSDDNSEDNPSGPTALKYNPETRDYDERPIDFYDRDTLAGMLRRMKVDAPSTLANNYSIGKRGRDLYMLWDMTTSETRNLGTLAEILACIFPEDNPSEDTTTANIPAVHSTAPAESREDNSDSDSDNDNDKSEDSTDPNQGAPYGPTYTDKHGIEHHWSSVHHKYFTVPDDNNDSDNSEDLDAQMEAIKAEYTRLQAAEDKAWDTYRQMINADHKYTDAEYKEAQDAYFTAQERVTACLERQGELNKRMHAAKQVKQHEAPVPTTGHELVGKQVRTEAGEVFTVDYVETRGLGGELYAVCGDSGHGTKALKPGQFTVLEPAQEHQARRVRIASIDRKPRATIYYLRAQFEHPKRAYQVAPMITRGACMSPTARGWRA